MINRGSEPFGGLFSFPFGRPQSSQFSARQTDSEFIIEGDLKGFKREDVKLELTSNGLLLFATQMIEREEKDEEGNTKTTTLPGQRIERFFPIPFPFAENDVKATFSEENNITITVLKNDANRKFISIE